VVSIEAHNFVKFSPYEAIPDENHHEFTLTFGQMQADMRDVAFYFRKKTGIPKMVDSGLADVLLGGEGLTVRRCVLYAACINFFFYDRLLSTSCPPTRTRAPSLK
jgi:hypothetical protein